MKHKLYCIIVVLIMILPFAAMLIRPTTTSTEKKELATWPNIIENNKINSNYMEEAGRYFEDHIAFRQEMVDVNARLKEKIFKTSANEQVIIGKNNWLYFSETLNDYMGNEQLSKREMVAVTHNLEQLDQYATIMGSKLIIMVVPNKNTIYPENMPSNYLPGINNNLINLQTNLEEKKLTYVDLLKGLQKQEEVLYFSQDTHWNTRGANKAYSLLAEKIGLQELYDDKTAKPMENHKGDLAEMLYPISARKEINYEYNLNDFVYTNQEEVVDNMSPWIVTSNEKKQDKLLMFRDSFGESLLPFLANNFKEGYFSRYVPYNMSQILSVKPDYVIIERTERKIAAFATEMPIMENLITTNLDSTPCKTNSSIKIEEDGDFVVIQGLIDQKYIHDNTEVFVEITNEKGERKTYIPFYTLTKTGDGNGYHMKIYKSNFSKKDKINVIINNEGTSYNVKSYN